MKNNEITKVTRQSELARAAALEAAGEHGDAAQVRYMVEKTWPETCAVPRTCHDLLPGDTAEQYKPAVSEYEQQAQDFLSRNGLKFRATLSDSKTPAWAKEGEETGHHYRVTLSRHVKIQTRALGEREFEYAGRLTFDFWSSIADAQAGVLTVTPYSVLACISGDAYTPETFADFCAEYGYESDSIKALQQFRRCARFAKRLRAFFTAAELEQLSEIQ